MEKKRILMDKKVFENLERKLMEIQLLEKEIRYF